MPTSKSAATRGWIVLAAMATAATTAFAAAPEIPGAQLIIRDKGSASVTERREVRLLDGDFELQWEGVSAKLTPDSLQLRVLDKTVTVFEQRFEAAATDRAELLKQYIGKRIQFLRGGNTVEGTLLSAEGDKPAVLLLDSGETLINPGGELVLPRRARGPAVMPYAAWQLHSQEAGPAAAEISYLTDGLKWEASYVLAADSDLTEGRLTGWVTITNNTGLTFRDAQVHLESEQVRKVEALQPVTESEVVEYPLGLAGKGLTLPAGESVRLAFLPSRVVQLQQVYLFDPLGATPAGPTPPQRLKQVLRVPELGEAALPAKLPGGRALVYRQSPAGVRLLNDERLAAVGPNDDFEVVLGQVAGIVGQRKQTAFREVAPRQQEQDVELRLDNKTKDWVEALAVEHPWPQWEIVESSHPYQKRRGALQFAVMLAPEAVTTVTFRVRMKY